MALSITSVSPNTGITPGHDRITILGTDFDVHPFPPAPGFVGTPQPWPPAAVTIGGQPAHDVWVYPTPGGAAGETTIECSTPRYVGPAGGIPAAVDVVVTNRINPGSATEAGGFTYEKPDAVADSVLTQVVHALLNELKRQMPVEVVALGTHTDFDESSGDGLNLVELAKVPALTIAGPRLSRSAAPYQKRRTFREVADPDFRQQRGAVSQDLTFELMLIDDHKMRALNLASWLTTWVRDNDHSLRVELVKGDPTSGFRSFDVDWDQTPQAQVRAGKDNLSTATARIIVRGVPIDRDGGVEQHRAPTMEDNPTVTHGTL